MAPWDPIIDGIGDWIINQNLSCSPESMFLILVVSLITSSISVSITRLTLDLDSLNAQMQKVQKWNKMKRKAMATADKKMWLRVKRDESTMQQLQMSMMTSRMKPTFITMLPFILIFSILRGVFDPDTHSNGGIVAVLPFQLNPTDIPWLWKINTIGHRWNEYGSGIRFGTLYFMTAISVGSLLSKIFGTAPPSKD